MARKNRKKRRGWRWTTRLIVAGLAAIAISVLVILPLRWFDPPTSAFMLQDQSGRDPLLQWWVEWERLGPAPPLAIVASEDQKFADHYGLDFDSILASIEARQGGGRLRGASTISQQVAKNLFLWPGRNVVRKGLEAYLTVVVEACLPKRRILEIYLNIAEFGPGVYGVGAASDYYFNKAPARLSDYEAALLAAVLPSPNQLRVNEPSPYVRERQQWILGQMRRLRREGWITQLQ